MEDFPTDIPLTPNIREPNKKSSTYKEIFNSLVSEPKAFFNRNNGIKISLK
ncbi:AIPR family protein [Tolypothrix bouteillei VB521301_2]|uniref:AIPR family protein n=1 Tax=Tolypothrix bouteillei TaxID=1246981 RepID=UPI0038B57D26